MSITSKYFGKTSEGQEVTLYTITNKNGNSVSVINYGAAVQSIIIKAKNGQMTDVVLGYDSIEEYEAGKDCFGAICGRVANRIANAEFTLNGKNYQVAKNIDPHHLHGGPKGFHRQMWQAMTDDANNIVSMTRISDDGEEGYPGTLKVAVNYIFDDYDRLLIDYWAQSDQDTIMNLTNHTYFNLSGHGNGTVLDHTLQIYSHSYTESDADSIPTGRILETKGTPMDFKKAKPIGQDIHSDFLPLQQCAGYDHNYCIDKTLEDTEMRNVAILYSPETEIRMYVTSHMPGMQVYTGNFIQPQKGKDGATYNKHSGIALETQKYPDAVHHDNFPSIVLKADELFRSTTTYEFEVEQDEEDLFAQYSEFSF